MENSVEIMCIDICLNSSNIKRMRRKKGRVIVIMYSSWFKGFYSPLRQNDLSLWDAMTKVHHQRVFWVKFLRNNAQLVTIKRQVFAVFFRVRLSCEFSRLPPNGGLARRLGDTSFEWSSICCFFSQSKQLVKKASWRTKTILGKYNLVQTFWRFIKARKCK